MLALLVLASDAQTSDLPIIAGMIESGVALQVSPIVVVVPAGVDVPSRARVVRARRDASPITAIRIGMAQLTNTMATSVLLWPFASAAIPVVSLLALIDAATRDAAAIVAPVGTSLDLAPIVVPRDAWLELVTLGEGGLDALAARRRIVRIDLRGASR